MKDADAWFAEGMKDVGLSWHADYQSELRGDLEDAIADFDQALALAPEHADAWFQKGIALARLDRDEEAVAALAEATRLRPDDPERWLQRAKTLACLGRHEEALAAFDATLSRRPDDSDAEYGRAEALEALRRDPEALAAWDRVLRSPEDGAMNLHGRQVRIFIGDTRRLRARVSRANALVRLGRHAEAVAAYRDVFRDSWQPLHAPLAPSVFHDALRDLEAARTAYYEHLRSEDGNPGAWTSAGSAFLHARRPDDALQAYETAVRLAPDDPHAWWGKAEALVQADRRREAVSAYKEALRVRPGYVPAAARLKVVLDEIAASDTTPRRT